MKTITAIVIVSFGLAASAFAQTVIANITPDKMESRGLSFSVQTAVLTNATQFTVSVTCVARHPTLPEDYYATLRTMPEPPPISTQIINGKPVVTRPKMDNEKGDRVPPSSTVSNQTSSVTYSFPVANKKLAHATFMFWAPARQFPERCYRLDLKQFTEKSNPQGGANGRQPSGSETNRTSAAAASRRSP
jgi:hypothetical protein